MIRPMPIAAGAALLAVLLVLLPTGCTGESSGGVTCTGCNGCCQQGVCMPGNTPGACGTGGQPCNLCGPGVACVAGKCSAGGPTCSCPSGCCDTANACQPGTANAACGLGGALCVACAPGTVCAGGSCQAPTCSCPQGCCQGQTCLAGDSDGACGGGGQPCGNCLGLGLRCNLSTRQCEGQSGTGCAGCGPATCCNGNSCVPGDADDACGSGGPVACVNCLLQGMRCDPVNRVCGGCANCDQGCCVGTICQAGTDKHACGSGGSPCEDCGGLGLKCGTDQGGERVCVALCEDCDSGCCFGPSCVGGFGDSACGKAAQACQDCTEYGESCLAGSRTCSGTWGCPNCFTGCCQGSKCRSGTGIDACGKDAEPCVNCLQQDPTHVCHPTARTCGPPQQNP